MNPFALASVVCTVIAVLGMVGFGFVVVAVFGVGAGHVALQQIRTRNQRGAVLAYISLAVCYLIAVVALLSTISASVGLLAQ